jgi:hypothetical protein
MREVNLKAPNFEAGVMLICRVPFDNNDQLPTDRQSTYAIVRSYVFGVSNTVTATAHRPALQMPL